MSSTIPSSSIKQGDPIGHGSFGVVYKGEYNGSPVAIKVLTQIPPKEDYHAFLQEGKMLASLNHPNIVKFVGVTEELPETPPKLITELLHCSLHDVLFSRDKRVKMDTKTKEQIMLGITRGLAVLHTNSPPVIHRDLKSPNILVDKELKEVKICDMGWAKQKLSGSQYLKSKHGTPFWMAPEVLLEKPYKEPADIYSLGMVFYELWNETRPRLSMLELIKQAESGERPAHKKEDIPEHWKTLINHCWANNPKERWNVMEILYHIEQNMNL